MEGIGEALVTCTAGGAWWQISKANCHLQALVQFQRGEAAQFVCFFFVSIGALPERDRERV